MSPWNLLDPEEENQLHKSRLFSIEEKPFKRITKRLTPINSLASTKIRQTLTPPPESNGTAEQQENDAASPTTPALDFLQLKEDITFDFAALDYTIGRLQFLQSANENQRDKYAAERVSILDTCAAVRENTTQLRAQLAEAQATRAQRMQWDALTKKINDNKMLQERPKQTAALAKLEEECRQLEAESETYAETWRERKEQFSRIMDESMRLRRLIRDEKEEVERREGMDEGEGEADGAEGGQTPRPGSSQGNATPRPDVPTVKENGDGTPRAASVGGRTPLRDSPAPNGSEGLKPRLDGAGGFSRSGSRTGSRDVSPARGSPAQGEVTDSGVAEDGEDVEMGDSTRSEETPRIVVEGQIADDKMDTS